MELYQLRTFLAVVRRGNFSRAAEELHLSQPAVSNQVQALESELGVRLLERLPRRLLLTAEGEVLRDYAQRIANLERKAQQHLAELKELQAGCVHVGASPTIGAYLLPHVLGRFHDRYPGLRVIVEIESSYRVAKELATHRIDVGLTETAVEQEGIDAKVFHDDELVLIVPTDHPWAMRQSVRAEELTTQPLIAREPRSGTRALVERRLRAMGVQVTPALELGGIGAIKNAVIAGLGVAFVSRLAIRAEERAGLLASLRVEGLSLHYPFYYCLRHLDQYPSAALEAFLGFVRAASEEGAVEIRDSSPSRE